MHFLVIVIVALACQTADGSQMVVDPSNPLAATFNSSRFDISNVFKWPVHINDDPRGYAYVWDPTGKQTCQSPYPSPSAGVCQLPGTGGALGYTCGRVDAALWLLNSFDPPQFTIIYPGGVEWRLTVINFYYDASQNDTTIQFVSEDPYLQYTFEVRGKCVGQPASWSIGCHDQAAVSSDDLIRAEWAREVMDTHVYARTEDQFDDSALLSRADLARRVRELLRENGELRAQNEELMRKTVG